MNNAMGSRDWIISEYFQEDSGEDVGYEDQRITWENTPNEARMLPLLKAGRELLGISSML